VDRKNINKSAAQAHRSNAERPTARQKIKKKQTRLDTFKIAWRGGTSKIKAKASWKIQIYLHFDAFKTKREK